MTPVTHPFELIGATFSLYPFGFVLQPLIEEVLREHGQMKWRKGTLLVPPLLVWLVLGLVMRRDKNVRSVLSWMVNGFRWLTVWFPAEHELVAEGTISHARKRLGLAIFRDLSAKVSNLSQDVAPDFHGRTTVLFDGTTATMPDTASNAEAFGKPGSRTGSSAYPQMRIMSLMVMSVRMIVDMAAAPYRGKGTGEKTLVRQLLAQLRHQHLLIVMDAGLYAFDILWQILDKHCDCLLKVPGTVKKLTPLNYLPDGSYIALLRGKILDPDAHPTPSGRRKWRQEAITVRIIPVQIPGFRPFLLMTTMLDSAIDARTIALHYHRRWDIEIAYDEIKTHQCATLRGQMPTTFRSKCPDLVSQELFAMLIVYNTTRYVIWQAATLHQIDPTHISFLDVWSHLIDSVSTLTALACAQPIEYAWHYLLALVAQCLIDRPRRPRSNPRVVKVKMSKFLRKQPHHFSRISDFAAQIFITPPPLLALAFSSL